MSRHRRPSRSLRAAAVATIPTKGGHRILPALLRDWLLSICYTDYMLYAISSPMSGFKASTDGVSACFNVKLIGEALHSDGPVHGLGGRAAVTQGSSGNGSEVALHWGECMGVVFIATSGSNLIRICSLCGKLHTSSMFNAYCATQKFLNNKDLWGSTASVEAPNIFGITTTT